MDKKKIMMVSLGHLSCDINAGALPASLPYVRGAYNLDYQATGGLMLAFACLSSITQPLLGLLADRHNKPWFIPLGIAMAGCGLAIVGFVGNYWAIFAGLMISGIGAAFFHPEAARFANRVAGAQKGVALSIFSIGGNSGFIIGPLLITIFVGFFGLHGMAVFAITGLAMAFVLYLMITRMTFTKPDTSGAATAKAAEMSAEMSAQDPAAAESAELSEPEVKETRKDNNWKEFFKLVGIIIARSMTFAGCNTFIPLYWVNTFGQSNATAAIALIIFSGFGITFNIIGGMLSDRLGYVRVIRIMYLCLPPILLGFAITENILIAYLFLPLLGFGLYTQFSAQVVLGQQLLAKNIGFASGITLGLGNTLGGVAQPCLGWVADNYGLHSIFICLACLAIMGSVFSFMLKNNDKQNAAR